MRPLNAADLPQVIDCETAPIEGIEEYLGEIRPPAHYKEQEAKDNYVKRTTEKEHDKAAVDIDLARICALAYWEPGFDAPKGGVARNEEEEEALIRAWLKRAVRKNGDLKIFVGFNILAFDLPLIWRRAMYLGIDIPSIQLDRFRHPNVVDVMQILSYDGKLKYRSKDFYCRRLGIHVEDTVTGSDVPLLALANEYGQILSHCKADVTKERLLAERIGVLERQPDPAAEPVPF